MRIGINCGHTVSGTPGSGASGYLDESNETRAVGNALIKMLRNAGCKVVNCTNNKAASVSENLAEICRLANAQHLDAFISIHFNSGGGVGAEAYTYGGENKAYAGKMLAALNNLGFKNRGIKNGSHLYVIKHTKAPSCLLEVCFVDSKTDAELYQKIGAEAIASALCKAILGIKPDKEDLTMSQYEELKNEISELTETVKLLVTELHNIKNPMIYNYIDDNMPEWSKPTIQKLVNKGYLQGDDKGLNLTDDLLRILVINDRAGLYD